MLIGQALDLVSRYDSLRNPLTSLGDYLAPELISRCLAESGTVTLHKRRLPLEMMVWCIVGMALERKEPLHQIANRLDIMLPGNRPFVAPSAVIQTRQRLGIEAVRRVFTKTAQLWHNATPHPHWCGLTLLAIENNFLEVYHAYRTMENNGDRIADRKNDLCSIRAGGKYVMYHGILSGGAGILHGMLSG